MHAVVGPVVTREGGYAFDWWTPEEGLRRGYSYHRVEDAHYARKVEIRSRARSYPGPMVACGTVDEFTSALADRPISLHAAAAAARRHAWPADPSA